MDQPQTGYQESPQTYQSLMPQNGQFSPAIEASSPFVATKGSNALQSMAIHLCRHCFCKWIENFSLKFNSCLVFSGETTQSYSCHSDELYDSNAQRQSSSFWPDYTSSSFTAPLPHSTPATCPITLNPQSSEQYCPRVVKRKNPHPQRPEREGPMTGMSAYPGQHL